MKRVITLLLVLAMLLSLTACADSDKNPTDPSSSGQAATDGKENTTDSTTDTTGATQESTGEPTSAPTSAPTTAATQASTQAPTQAPTVAPTQPTPTACSHNWKAATCTAAKTCTKCGATEGNAAGHSYTNATCTAPKTCTTCGATDGNAAEHSYSNGACSACGAADPNYKKLTDGAWVFRNEQTTVVLAFNENGIVSTSALEVVDTAEEFRKLWTDTTADEYSWYSVYDIGGTHYVAREEISYDSFYSIEGQTVHFDIFMCPESITWDGYTATAAPQSGSGWLNNMGKGQWISSGVTIIDDLAPYFG